MYFTNLPKYLIGKINVTYLKQFLSDYLKIYIT